MLIQSRTNLNRNIVGHLTKNISKKMCDNIKDIAINGNIIKLKKQIEKGVEIPKGILQNVIFSGWAQGENIEVLELLIQAGADVNGLENDTFGSPLHTAAAVGAIPNRSLATTDFLLKNGANPNIVNHRGETPLFIAVTTIASETVQRLIEGGADINIKNNEGIPLLEKCISSYSGFLVDEDKEDAEYYNEMAKKYVLDNLKHLLNANPDFTITNNKNYSVIQLCLLKTIFITNNFSAPILKLLIDKGCPTNIKTTLSDDLANLSLLALSISLNPFHSVEVIDALANVNDILEDEMFSPNLFELMYFNPKTGIELLELRPYLLKSEDLGNTLLHPAVQSQNVTVEIIEYLIKKGVDPNKKTDSGKSALSMAETANANKEIIELLRKYEQ